MESVELKQCPLCKSRDLKRDYWDAPQGGYHYIRCRGCGLELTGKDRQKIEELWNTRPLEAEARNDGLEEAAKRCEDHRPVMAGDYILKYVRQISEAIRNLKTEEK